MLCLVRAGVMLVSALPELGENLRSNSVQVPYMVVSSPESDCQRHNFLLCLGPPCLGRDLELLRNWVALALDSGKDSLVIGCCRAELEIKYVACFYLSREQLV